MEGGRCYRAVTGMTFAAADGVSRVVVGHVYDLQAPYRRVRYPDGDWEELSRREVTSGAERCRGTRGRKCGFPPAAGAWAAWRAVCGNKSPVSGDAHFGPSIVVQGGCYDAGPTVRDGEGKCRPCYRVMTGMPSLCRRLLWVRQGVLQRRADGEGWRRHPRCYRTMTGIVALCRR